MAEADVVDEHVDAAERGDARPVDHRARAGFGRDVGGHGMRHARASRGRFLQSVGRRLSASSPRAQMTTCAPSAISAVAAASPSPRLPPVTTATFLPVRDPF